MVETLVAKTAVTFKLKNRIVAVVDVPGGISVAVYDAKSDDNVLEDAVGTLFVETD